MKFAVSIVLTVAAGVSPAFAQDACVALLKNGIYNTYSETQQGASSSSISHKICSNYSLYKSNNLQLNSNGTYNLVASGGEQFTKQEVEAIGQAMCSSNFSDADASNAIDNFSSVVSPTVTGAFNDCMKNEGEGLIVSTNYDPSSPLTVTIDAHYNRVGNGPNQNRVHAIKIVDNSSGKYPVTCTGPLKSAADTNGLISSAVLTITCTRPVENDPSKAFPILGHLGGLAFPASVTIPTDIASIYFEWPAIYLPPPVSPVPPAFIGEIRAVSFQTNSPGFAALKVNGWIECDGSVLSASDYPALYAALGNTWGTDNDGATFKIPDLRGEFLRGWSHGSPVDPDASARKPADPNNPHAGWSGAAGDSVGSTQLDSFAAHSHPISGSELQAAGGGSATNGFYGTGLRSNSGQSDAPWNTAGSTLNVGGAETRPKNVSVMYVIYTGKK